MSEIRENYQEIKKQLLPKVNLLAVSKTKSVDQIKSLFDLGHKNFGENKVQELIDKSLELGNLAGLNWHFIGHLQTNKINQLLKVKHLTHIHSIDRMSLVEKLIKKKTKEPVNLFIQVNTSFEEQKGGFSSKEQVLQVIELFENHESFKVTGLMTMGKIRTDHFERDSRQCFERLKNMRDDISQNLQLSMGMSADFKWAQDYDTDWVRIGSSLFGSRD